MKLLPLLTAVTNGKIYFGVVSIVFGGFGSPFMTGTMQHSALKLACKTY